MGIVLNTMFHCIGRRSYTRPNASGPEWARRSSERSSRPLRLELQKPLGSSSWIDLDASGLSCTLSLNAWLEQGTCSDGHCAVCIAFRVFKCHQESETTRVVRVCRRCTEMLQESWRLKKVFVIPASSIQWRLKDDTTIVCVTQDCMDSAGRGIDQTRSIQFARFPYLSSSCQSVKCQSV